ncbi:MAG TPA: RidA family protein [Gammaproteobacteria bacterium]|nr:RidA family protein [Gammaproteobacteria bacterium]
MNGARMVDWTVRHLPEPARCVVVGNVVFLSGCAGAPETASVEEQVTAALDQARLAMEQAGASMGNIVKTFFLVTSLDDYGRVRKTETEYYERHAPQLVTTPPAATLMVVPSLERPGVKVQYEAIGAVDRGRADWAVKYYPEFWAGRELAYPHVPKEHAKFARSQAVGNLLIVSGCQALDHGTVRVETADFDAQSRIVLDKVKVAMEETGGTLANVVKTHVFIKDAAMLRRYRDVEREFFAAHAPEFVDRPPASTALVVSELPRREFLVEVEAFGVADGNAPGWNTRYHVGAASAGKLLFVSGCRDSAAGGPASGPIERQVAAALDEVKAAMERAGSSLDKVVKTTLLLRDRHDYPAMRAAELAYYRRHAPQLVAAPPASTFMQVAAIGDDPAARFEMDAIGVL